MGTDTLDETMKVGCIYAKKLPEGESFPNILRKD